MNRWLWICPILAVLLSITVLFYWGWSWTSGGLIALVVACLATIIWMSFYTHKQAVESHKMYEKKRKGEKL